ncbi:MAG TPA: ATP-grasp domain-containing protein [Phycisphaerae bacterium]|nr:ATP-grasp domain-containing protein [Phycisphaerae bacterium]HOJ72326.1 ATP-grasp domain-containing protein [Phycisphaerae bacterium]HOM50012.1 ATP-grasp domain-containing protein [Phycisphaerae bacterium]HON65343.1 ATP-grasp domain-containing protein [Phycisphaerae bacterium]HOQ84740.1 ATP-grasp domain-containing protein [Phycisphaerae bacterium]
MFTCAGRRVELIQSFVRAARTLGIEPVIHVADVEPYFAAACIADASHRVPLTSSPDYIASLIEIARRERIDLLIPLIDLELQALSEARERFAEVGCHVIISSPRVVRTCGDKLSTFSFLTEHGIAAPQTWLPEEILRRDQHQFPYFLKPRWGSASKGNYVIRDEVDLQAFVPRVPGAIIQEFLPGTEYTLDVYTGFNGLPRCVVPRRRIEVRGGEVTKSLTVRHEGIIRTGVRVVEALNECVGLITIQLFLRSDGQIHVIEINPRFGGGAPLAIHAGADFPRWLLAEWLGQDVQIRLDQFRDGVMMLRYHQSFFKEGVPNELE